MVISSAFQSFDLCKELLLLFLLILSMFASFSTASNNFFKVVSAISAADKSFSFKSGNSPILLRTKFPVTFSLVNESRTSSSELGRLCLSSSNCSHSSLSLSVSVYLRLKFGCGTWSVVSSSTFFFLFI